MVMIARLKGIPFTRDEGDIRISLEKLPKSLNVFVNKAVRRHPMTIVLRQVRPNNATFTQGNFCWGASSNSISADGLNELSMKRVLLPLVSVGPTGQPIAVRRFAASLIGQWPVPPRFPLASGRPPRAYNDCKSLPGLKRTAFPGGIFTSEPVRGFRPIPVFRGFTENTPKPRNSIRSLALRASFMQLKIVSTACSAFVLLTPVRSTI